VKSDPDNYQLSSDVFDAQAFLTNVWQKKACVFRGAFKNFCDPLTPDELAGIASEAGVDSRVITCASGDANNKALNWDLQHGPVDDYDQFGSTGWTLLVQAVNEHFSPAQSLLRAFRFLPDWRIDDLMVSFSAPGGGVGPHIDQYDVFIIQGEGRRRWQTGAPGNYAATCPHPDLKQIEGFSAITDDVLEPGDMIYIPAGVPHNGISIDHSLNYSVGFRAPSQAELLSALADYALEHDALQKRYTDDTSDLPAEPWLLHEGAVQRCKTLLLEALDDEQLLLQICAKVFSTNPRPPLPEWPEEPVNENTVNEWLAQSEFVYKAIGLRMIVVDGFVVCQGHWFASDTNVLNLFHIINDAEDGIESAQLAKNMSTKKARAFIAGLINEGLVFN